MAEIDCMGKRARAALVNATLTVASVILALAVLEFGSQIYIDHFREKHLARWEFRATQPPPYKDAEYFNSEFLKEAATAGASEYDHNGLPRFKDYSGKYFNMRGGLRVTSDTPEAAQRRILFFGNSTAACMEVPDAHTITSYLQRLINRKSSSWQVLNYGYPAASIEGQSRLVRAFPPRAGDIVIFYDGGSEARNAIFMGNRERLISGVPGFRPLEKLSFFHKIIFDVFSGYRDTSAIAKIALDFYDRGKPVTVTQQEQLDVGISYAVESYESTLREVVAFVKDAGAVFIHFFQPAIYTLSNFSDYERKILANPFLAPPGLSIAFERGYPRLRGAALALTEFGVSSFDISDVFNHREDEEEFYLDWSHVNHKGNERVARRMYQLSISAEIERK